jgi:2-polyprenyl-6-methoxyphenol hydroxylase-like FAD-dependent oxidoreductase
MHVAIVGGGIAGLAFALVLHERGVSCRVYEASPEVKELGVGITLLPHAMRELSALGLEGPLLAAGIETEKNCFFNRFGQLAYEEIRGRKAGYPTPEVGISRGRLHGILYRAVLERLGPDAVVANRRCVSVEQDGEKATVAFAPLAGGTVPPAATADLVVACDGVNSTIRKQFYPDDAVCFNGINTWRGLTVHPPIWGGRSLIRIGSIHTGKLILYPIADDVDGKGGQLINWVAELLSDTLGPNDWNKPGRAEDVVPIFKDRTFDWLDVPALIRDAEAILEYPMVDKEPIEQWVFGRVALMGDAAHPMYPRGANGSAQALIDARVLGNLLASDEPLAALKAYEAIRAPQAARVVRTNRTTPPDLINIEVERRTGDRPFENLDDHVTQAELKAISDRYKQIAGFALENFTKA